MSLPGEEQVSGALSYLAKTDEEWARACAALEAAELAVKTARDVAFLEFDTGTQAERSARANTTGSVRHAHKRLEEAVFAKRFIEAKRARAILTIDVWRSLNSNRRAGMI
jgi:hypothetical protein